MPTPEEVPDWKQRAHEIIFQSDTKAGKLFDVLLLLAILLSVLVVMLESVHAVNLIYGRVLRDAEWVFAILFSIEYMMRIVVVRRPLGYIFSFLGIIDLLSVAPTILSLFIAGGQYLLVIRAVRLLRTFRILKLGRFIDEASVISNALKASRYKILVFLLSVLTLVVIVGSFMYVIEGGQHGFTSIPVSVYWAIVTLTTVGYGDISPSTVLGQTLASMIMILGYAIIAVPTGIVTAELAKPNLQSFKQVVCNVCQATEHQADAEYCRCCGEKL